MVVVVVVVGVAVTFTRICGYVGQGVGCSDLEDGGGMETGGGGRHRSQQHLQILKRKESRQKHPEGKEN